MPQRHPQHPSAGYTLEERRAAWSLRALLLLCVVLLALVLSPSFAAAAPPACGVDGDQDPALKALLEEADAALQGKRYEAAKGHFQEALRVCPAPQAMRGLAASYRGLGDCHMARYWYEEMLNRLESQGAGSTGQDASDIAGEGLEALATLEPQCPQSARLTITNRRSVAIEARRPPVKASAILHPASGTPIDLGTLPFSGRVPAGAARVEVKMEQASGEMKGLELENEGRYTLVLGDSPLDLSEQTLRVRCAVGSEDFELDNGKRLGCPHNGSLQNGQHVIRLEVNGAPVSVEIDAKEGTLNDVRVPTPSRPVDGLQSADWGWFAAGAGVVLVSAGIGVHFAARDLQDNILGLEPIDGSGTIGMTRQQAEDNLDRAELLNNIGVGVAAVGGAALVGGIVLILLPDDPYALEVAPSVSESQASLTLTLPF